MPVHHVYVEPVSFGIHLFDASPQFAEVGRRMGWAEAFAWQTPAAVFREHAALSGHANNGRRMFDISAMAELDEADYAAMQPFRWPLPTGAVSEGGRLFAQGGFSTLDGRARFVPTRYQPLPAARAIEVARAAASSAVTTSRP